MLWLTWRQHRLQAAITLALVLLVGGYFLWTGLRAQSLADELGLASCTKGQGPEACNRALGRFSEEFFSLTTAAPFANFLLVLVAVFWGAPLVAREIETGTSRLVWTQSISRLRWLSTKLVTILAGAAAIGAIQGALFWWWYGTMEPVVESRFLPEVFDLQGIVPIGYALFAAAGGVAIGAFLPRTLGAMVLAAVGYVGVRLAVSRFARPHFSDPVEAASEPFSGERPPETDGAWGLEGYFVTADGHRLSFDELSGACPDGGDVRACFAEAGIQHIDVYHPADRFWSFQAIELGIFLALTAACVGLAMWRIRSVR